MGTLQSIKKRQEGFTIIEVMIVLVIAAVILLIVFLAVPALQRNSRNTQVKNEAAALLGAAAEFTSNNGGVSPLATDNGSILGLTKNKNITALTVVPLSAGVMGTPGVPTANTGVLMVGGKCSGTTAVAGTARQIALLYLAETGASGASQSTCTESGL
ncbi:MAG: prepilin-type N-terminal cleavage/methylation domain-containing protein [Candidatus Saccharibacteria bacterium]